MKHDITIEVTVTADDIANGNRADGLHCPVARALTRIFRNNVHVGSVSIVRGFRGWRRMLPNEVVEFIKRFDEGEPVSPIVFYVRVPSNFVQWEKA